MTCFKCDGAGCTWCHYLGATNAKTDGVAKRNRDNNHVDHIQVYGIPEWHGAGERQRQEEERTSCGKGKRTRHAQFHVFSVRVLPN